MEKQLFGTDGIRGVAGEYPLDDKTVYATGLALAAAVRRASSPPQVVIGMDTRESSLPLARLVSAGLAAGGAAVDSAGVTPTAAVAYLTVAAGYDAGIMISASHNSFQDNGIKVFGPSGFKLPDAEEHQLEEEILRRLGEEPEPQPRDLVCDATLTNKYLQHLLAVDRPQVTASLSLVADCANGAAYVLAPQLFRELGVRAEILAAQPDGRNINLNCGSLHLDALQRKVVDSGAALGVAFDGDADRALFVAEDGSIVDGDAVLLIVADYLARQGKLAENLVVTTVMANMGLEKALEQRGLRMTRTAVGDKYVLEEMLRSGAVLGGEQSGHVIFREYATTGDGLLTARMLLGILAESGQRLSGLKNQLKIYPQELKNLKVKRKVPFDELPVLKKAIQRCEKDLDGRGRLLVRYSGTEPLVRIMVEAEDAALVREQIDGLAEAFERQLGA